LTTSYDRVPTHEFAGSFEAPGVTPGGMGTLARGAADLVTGNSAARPELPALHMPGLGLGPLDAKAWGIIGNMALSRDPAALERAIASRLPEAKFAGEGPERTVQVPGGPEMYLDRPGFTPQKALFYGPQTAAALASSGRSIAAQMALAGGQHALSTAGSYGLGGAASPVDPFGTALAVAAPGVLGAAGAGLIKAYDWLNSEVTPPAAEAVRRLGLQGMSAADQAASAIAERARTLYRWGFAGKPGDILNDPVLIAKEDLAANAGPPGARRLMSEFHRTNAGMVDTNKREIIARAAGDVPPGRPVPPEYAPNESEFGDRINTAVAGRAAALRGVERQHWDAIGDLSPTTEAGRSVAFSPDVSAEILGNHATTMNRFFGEPQGPGGAHTPLQLGDTGQLAADAFTRIRQILLPPAATEGGVRPIMPFNLGHLQDMRQMLGNIVADKPGTTAAAAAQQMRRQIDAAVANAEATPGQLVGNPAALERFRAANTATRARHQFMEPEDNPAAERLVAGITNPAAPATGQETITNILGSGNPVTPGGGTNPVVVHLGQHLGSGFNEPASGALTLRTLYGNRGTSATAETTPARYDYDSTSNRIAAQLGGRGSDVTDALLHPDVREQLGSFQRALDILGAAGRRGGPRQNASGTGYVGMMTRELPFGLGPMVDRLQATLAAQRAVQGGAELVDRAARGANTEAGLQIRLPRQSTIQGPDPRNPFYDWQPGAWRAGTPIYRGGGLLGAEALEPTGR
jgi:hypothetical protein